jgi:hypothetical protein
MPIAFFAAKFFIKEGSEFSQGLVTGLFSALMVTAVFSIPANTRHKENFSVSEKLIIRQYSFGFLPCLLLLKLHIILQELVGGAI